MRDPETVDRARQTVRRAAMAEATWRQAVTERDRALRAAAAANPDAGWQGLARVIGEGLTANILRAAARTSDPSA